MKSLYALYIHEREKISTFETGKWFFTYRINEDEFTVYDFFILKEFRGSAESKFMMDTIEGMALLSGCNWLVGFLDKETSGWEASLKAQERRGMKIIKEDGSKLTLAKEVLRG